jgi:hypothetical protein
MFKKKETELKNKNADRRDNNLNCLINSTWVGFPLRHIQTRKEHEVSHRLSVFLTTPVRSFASEPLASVDDVRDKKWPAS